MKRIVVLVALSGFFAGTAAMADSAPYNPDDPRFRQRPNPAPAPQPKSEPKPKDGKDNPKNKQGK